VIAVPSHGYAEWIKFADGMSVKLDAWWRAVARRSAGGSPQRI
jgi:hypothetical protein